MSERPDQRQNRLIADAIRQARGSRKRLAEFLGTENFVSDSVYIKIPRPEIESMSLEELDEEIARTERIIEMVKEDRGLPQPPDGRFTGSIDYEALGHWQEWLDEVRVLHQEKSAIRRED